MDTVYLQIQIKLICVSKIIFNIVFHFISLDLNHTSSELAFCLSGSRGFENCFKVPYKPFEIRKKWYHSCVVLTGLDENSVFAKVQIWSQGKLQLTKEFTTILDPVLDGNGILILGQEQDSYGGGFDKFQSFSGQIAQFNMFTR